MRFKIIFNLATKELGFNYREALISLIKSSLSDYEGGEYFDDFYDECNHKSFTYAVRLPQCKFLKESISLSDAVLTMYLSTANACDAVVLYNSLNSKRYKSYPFTKCNTATIAKIVMEKEVNVYANSINCQLAMPLALRVHSRSDNKDRYVLYNDTDFSESIKKAVIAQLELDNIDKSLADGFDCMPVNCKKSVVKFKGSYVTGTLGIIRLSGQPKLLDYLYKSGIGSRRSSGFGFINIIS